MRKRQVKCPTCGRLSCWEDEPLGLFCSDRCRLIDMGNWADERYRIADDPQNDENGFEPGEADEKHLQ